MGGSSSQVGLTFAIVFGVIIYRISTAAALAISSTPSGRSSVRVTVTATAVIINLVVIIILDEVYGCIARWLTQIGALEPSARCKGLNQSTQMTRAHEQSQGRSNCG